MLTKIHSNPDHFIHEYVSRELLNRMKCILCIQYRSQLCFQLRFNMFQFGHFCWRSTNRKLTSPLFSVYFLCSFFFFSCLPLLYLAFVTCIHSVLMAKYQYSIYKCWNKFVYFVHENNISMTTIRKTFTHTFQIHVQITLWMTINLFINCNKKKTHTAPLEMGIESYYNNIT